MDMPTKVALKSVAFGIAMPLITIPLTSRLPDWFAWGIAATVSCALFHWLPPRIHQNLTPWRSTLLSLATGVAAALAVAAVEMLPL